MHKDKNDDFLCDQCGQEFDDGSDICNHRDADDDNLCDYCFEKYNDGPNEENGDKTQQGGGDSTQSGADMSLVDVNKFYFGFIFESLDFLYEPIIDAYTDGMFSAGLEFYLGYEGSDLKWANESANAPISTNTERVTNDMTFLATADEAAEFVRLYLEQISNSNIENAVEGIIHLATGKWPSDEQLTSFIDDVFGPDEFRELMTSSFANGFEIMTAGDEYGYNDFVEREPVTITHSVRGTEEWSRYKWMTYLPISHFSCEQTALEYYANGDYQELVYSFDLNEHLDALEGKGLTVTDDGILINDAFFNAFDSDEGGIEISDEQVLMDGTTQIINFILYADSCGIIYDIEAPEIVYAELNFENGVSVAFDVEIADSIYNVTVSNYNYRDITPSSYIAQVSKWLKERGQPANSSVETELVMKVPDAVTFTAIGIPVSEYEFNGKLEKAGEFVFTYGERTTVLKSGVSSQMGVGFETLVGNLCVPNGDSKNSLLLHMLYNNDTYIASSTPYTIECITKTNSSDNAVEFNVSASIQLESVISSIALVDKNCIGKNYYIGDELEIAYGSMVNVYRRSSFRGTDHVVIEETVPVTKDMISGFDSSAELESGYMYVKYGDYSTNAIEYHVKRDFVTSIDVKLPIFGMDLYVVGLRLNIDGVSITAYYDSGKEIENIPLTMDMLSELPQSTGNHQLTVSYEGQTDTIALKVVKASKAMVYDGLALYYLLGEKPGAVEIKVEFEPNEFGLDYDVIVLGDEELTSFDTASAGNKTWQFSWAGVSVSHSYEVFEKAYVGYTPSDNGITINGVFINEKPEFYYELTSFKELIVPATIDGIPVVAIGNSAFAGLNMIKKLTVSEGILSIGDYAFRNASGLVEVELPLSATGIGKKIFSGCTALEKMYVSGDKKILDYFDGDLLANLTVYVKEGEDTLCENFLTLKDDMKLSKVVLPKTLKTIVTDSTSGEFWSMYNLCSYVLAFEVTPGGIFTSDDGVLFGDYGKTLLCYPFNKTDASYTVPDGVEHIVFMAYNNNLKTVTIPASVKTLGESVFTRNEQMTTVTLLGTLNALPNACFDGCESLVNFTLPKTLKSIGSTCFAYTKIATIIVPDGVTEIGYDAFRQCGVEKLAIPSSAMPSFAQLGEQTLTSLTHFAYDGSVRLNQLDAVQYNFGKIVPKLKNIYVYGTTSFEAGICGTTYLPFNVYVDSSVKSIGYGIEQSGGNYKVIYYYEGPSSSLSNGGGFTIQYNQSFNKWYLG
jgi:hypothetical protein